MAWADEEPALLVSYCLTHPLRGWGIVECRTDTANREGSKVPDRVVGRTWLCSLYHKLLRLPGGCFVLWLAWYFLRFLSVLLCVLFICSGAV